MTIRSVTIYKTPLDNSYSNVVDFINTEQHRQDVLFRLFDESYSHRTFQGLGRSIKRVGNSTLIVLPITYEEGRNYNYMIIEDDNQNLYFYFITNIVSENDSALNPSSSFTLEWDVWNNNIELFKDANNTIIKKHYDRFYFDDSEYKVKPLFYSQFINLNLPLFSEKIDFFDSDNLIPVFYVISLNEINNSLDYNNLSDALKIELDMLYHSATVDDPRGKTLTFYLLDSLSGKYNRNIVYGLAGLYNANTDTYVPCMARGKNFSVNDGGELFYWLENVNPRKFKFDGQPQLSIPKSLTPYINDISLSFYSPFFYDISVEDGYYFIEFTNAALINAGGDKMLNFTKLPLLITDVLVQKENEDGDILISEKNIGTISLGSKTYTIDFSEVTGLQYNLNQRPNFTEPARNVNIDPITFTPPFVNLFVSYNSDNFPLTIREGKNTTFVLTLMIDTPQPRFKIVSNGKLITGHTDKFIRNSGYFSFGVDSLENYMAKNSGQLEASRMTASLNMLVNMFRLGSGISSQNTAMTKNGVVGVISDIGRGMSIDASYNDSNHTPNEWVTNNGESDLHYQDRLRLTMDYIDRNNPVFIQFMNGVYSQGYSFPTFDSPFKNSRLVFDYVKTSGCNLSPLMINNNDIKKLEEIFDRGVTKWHIYQDDNGIRFEKNMIKDPNTLNNLEITTETNTSFHNWLYN